VFQRVELVIVLITPSEQYRALPKLVSQKNVFINMGGGTY
jgi:hypothetical protein